MEESANILMYFDKRQGTVPVVGLTQDESTAFITNVIFASVCMGMLGWEIIISLPFDLRLLRETNWRSILSTIHSLSYYLSRYSTLAFTIVYVVINVTSSSVANDHICQMRVTAAATMFIISECSVLLVFILRTIALWNLNFGVIFILMAGWLTTLILGIMIPANGKGILFGGFCTWHIEGKWVGISMITTAVTCVICLGATVYKLNKRGWKGLFQSMAPPSSRSIDAEDVSRLLVQRTTFFFVIMVISIAIGDAVYFSVNFFAWQLIAVPFYLMVSSNLAGRIFRRSWKMTHSSKYNMPPSYFPTTWHDSSSGSRLKSTQHSMTRLHTFSRFGSDRLDSSVNAFSFGPPLSPLDVSELPQHQPRLVHYRSDENFSFVEGVFKSSAVAGALSVKSLSIPTWRDIEDRTPAEMIAAESRALRRASEPAKIEPNMDRNDDTITPAFNENETIDTFDPSSVEVHKRDFGALSIAETPTFIPRAAHRDSNVRTQLIIRANSAGQSSSSGGRRGSSGGSNIPPPPFGSTGRVGSSIVKKHSKKAMQKRPTTDPTEKRENNHANELDNHSNTIDSPRNLGALGNGSPRPGTASSVVSDNRTQSSYPPNSSQYKHANWSTFTMSSNAPSIGNSTPPAPSNPFQSNNLSRLRDDLALVSSRGKLWLDSSAERARIEAAERAEHGAMYKQAKNISTSQLSSNSSTIMRSPPSSLGRSQRSTNSKRLILNRATEAGEYLSARSVTTARRYSTSNVEPSSPSMGEFGKSMQNDLVLREKTSRTSFLTSPAIVSQTPSSNVWSDRNNFDLDAMQRSLMATIDSHKRPITSEGERSTLQSQQSQAKEKYDSRQKIETRPRTAPNKSVERDQNIGAKTTLQDDAIDEVEDGGSDDPLYAFRQAVDHDIQKSRRNSAATTSMNNSAIAPPPFGYSNDMSNIDDENDNRPRTSRGGSLVNGMGLNGGSLSNRKASFTRPRSSSTANERPKTRNGGESGGSVKPFGFGLRISTPQNDNEAAQEDEYEEYRTFSTPLERIDTHSTVESHS